MKDEMNECFWVWGQVLLPDGSTDEQRAGGRLSAAHRRHFPRLGSRARISTPFRCHSQGYHLPLTISINTFIHSFINSFILFLIIQSNSIQIQS